MKRTRIMMLALCLMAILALWTTALPVCAYDLVTETPSKEILRGTPVVDGYLDEIYLQSYCYYLPKGTPGWPNTAAMITAMKNTEGVLYCLYDDNYAYFCAVVKDDTLMSMGEEWRMNTVWPWDDDGAEIYICLGDGISFSVHTDAHGIRSVTDTNIAYRNGGTCVYRDTEKGNWAASILDENTYAVELCFALKNDEKVGSKIGMLLEIDDRWDTAATNENTRGGIFKSQDPTINMVTLSATSDVADAVANVAEEPSDDGSTVQSVIIALAMVIVVVTVFMRWRFSVGKKKE